jgi:hypothetical protein
VVYTDDHHRAYPPPPSYKLPSAYPYYDQAQFIQRPRIY